MLRALTALALALGLGAPDALAQAAAPPFSGLHLVHAWHDDVKLADGTEESRRVEVLFDYDTGRTLQRVYGPSGARLLEREMATPVRASVAEIGAGRALVLADAEIAALVAEGAEVDGGYVHAPEDGRCGPGTRCLQFDVMSPDRRTSLRYVIVDLRAGEIVTRTFNARESR